MKIFETLMDKAKDGFWFQEKAYYRLILTKMCLFVCSHRFINQVSSLLQICFGISHGAKAGDQNSLNGISLCTQR